jgi:adenylate kinase
MSTGDLLREAVAAKTELGLKAADYMTRGLLVPDDLMLGLIREELGADDGRGWILDGFPRTLPQAEALSDLLESNGIGIDNVVQIDVDPGVIVKRVEGRRVCGECRAVYGIATLPGGEKAGCPKCGAPLIKRSDDEEETILRRFNVYREQTEPVLDYYRKRGGKFVAVNGNGDIDDITAEIIRALK